MTCLEIREQLPSLLYGDLPPTEAAPVEEHLAGCSACRTELAALQRLRKKLNIPVTPPVHVDLPQLYRQAAEQQATRVRRWRRIAFAVGSAAAVILLVMIVRLQVRIEAHQFVIAWGASGEVKPAADAPPPLPVREVAHSHGGVEDQLRLLKELIHALAADIDTRDRERQQELIRLTVRLQELQRSSAQQRQATERDVAALYTAFFGPKEKGTRQ